MSVAVITRMMEKLPKYLHSVMRNALDFVLVNYYLTITLGVQILRKYSGVLGRVEHINVNKKQHEKSFEIDFFKNYFL